MRDFAKYGKEQKMEDYDYGFEVNKRFGNRLTSEVYKEVARNPKDYGMISADYDAKADRWSWNIEHFGSERHRPDHLTRREQRVLKYMERLNKFAKGRYYKTKDRANFVIGKVPPEDWTPGIIKEIEDYPREYGFEGVKLHKDEGRLEISYGPEPEEIPVKDLPPVLRDLIAFKEKAEREGTHLQDVSREYANFESARKEELTPEVYAIIRRNPHRFGLYEDPDSKQLKNISYGAPAPNPPPKPTIRDADGLPILEDWEQKQVDDLERLIKIAEDKKMPFSKAWELLAKEFTSRTDISERVIERIMADPRKYGLESISNKNGPYPIDFSQETRATPSPSPTPRETWSPTPSPTPTPTPTAQKALEQELISTPNPYPYGYSHSNSDGKTDAYGNTF
jgi:hypothetical protein